MLRTHYHQSALVLAKITPTYSEELERHLSQITAALGIRLPESLVKWFCLDPEGHLFQQLTQSPHYFLQPAELSTHISKRRLGNRECNAIELIFENQGCYVMCASLEDGNDPPVWISEDFNFCEDHQPTWLLHSHTFSDCIKAFAWDFNCMDRADWRDHFRGIADIQELPEVQNYGPTTFQRSAWFIAAEFRRLEINNEPFTYMLNWV